MSFYQYEICFHDQEKQFFQAIQPRKIIFPCDGNIFHTNGKACFGLPPEYMLPQLGELTKCFHQRKFCFHHWKNGFYRKNMFPLVGNMFPLLRKTVFAGQNLRFHQQEICLEQRQKTFLGEEVCFHCWEICFKYCETQFLQAKNVFPLGRNIF